MKRVIIGFVITLSLFVVAGVVKAAEQYHQTTLSMGANTYLYGADRNYKYAYFKIMGNVTDRDSNESKQKLYMKLYKKNWLGNSVYENEGTSNYAGRDVYGYDFGKTSGSGKKYIYFKTRSANDKEAYGKIVSTNTFLVSYN